MDLETESLPIIQVEQRITERRSDLHAVRLVFEQESHSGEKAREVDRVIPAHRGPG
jgi:hypothetical protein